MADATYRSTTTVMSRRTRGNLRDAAAKAVLGLTASALNATDSALLNLYCNDEQEEWRMEFPGVRGFGERIATETWDTANTRHELPADFAELLPGARLVLLDTDGDEDDQLEVVERTAYDGAWSSADNRYDDRSKPIAYLWGTSTNDKRFLEIRPTPTTAVGFRLPYIAHLETLDDDSDELEAPLGMHGGIEAGITARFAAHKGSAKVDESKAERERIKNLFRNPVASERKRPGRLIPFEEAGGYARFAAAE